MPNGRVTVPIGFWKVIVDLAKKLVIGFELPQQAVPKTAIGASDEKSIAAIEADAPTFGYRCRAVSACPRFTHNAPSMIPPR
jgi:DNA/RNA endonuclease G (NUC1)